MADLLRNIYTSFARNILACCPWNIHTIFDRNILTNLILNRLLYNFRNIITYSPLLSSTIIYILCIALLFSYINTMLFRDFIAFFGWFIMTYFLVMDLGANFLSRWSANSFITDRTLLLGHILTFFLRNLTANLFFNLSVLFLSNSLAHVRSFRSTFPLISGRALAITNSLARRFDNGRTFLMVNGSTFS